MKKFLCIILSILTFTGVFTFCSCAENSGLCTYDITACYSEETSTLTAKMDFTFYNCTGENISYIKFNLYPNAYRQNATYSPVAKAYTDKAYYGGNSYGNMQINAVDGCKKWDVCGVDENVLLVEFERIVAPEQSVKISVDYSVKLASVNHRTGVGETSVSLANFYPTLCLFEKSGFKECVYYNLGDPYASACANFKLSLTLPEKYTVACSGQKTGEKLNDGNKILSFYATRMRDFTVIFSDRFNRLENNIDGVLVEYYFVADDDAQQTLNLALESLKYFSKVFAPYPYKTFTLVQTDIYYGGMEYGGLATIGKNLSPNAKIYTAVHEVAHEWWAEIVGNDQIEHAWLDEGLAEYSTALFFDEHKEDYGYTKVALVGEAIKSYRAYYTVYNQIFGDVNTTMNRSLKDFASEYEYVNIAYNKATILFDNLFGLTGKETFLSCLKDYYNKNAFSVASPDDLISCFVEKEAKTQGFFDAFINGKIII